MLITKIFSSGTPKKCVDLLHHELLMIHFEHNLFLFTLPSIHCFDNATFITGKEVGMEQQPLSQTGNNDTYEQKTSHFLVIYHPVYYYYE